MGSALGRRLAGLLGEERLEPTRYAVLSLQTTPLSHAAWDAARAEETAVRVAVLADGDPILALGRRAGEAFGVAPTLCAWTERRFGRVGLLPKLTRGSPWWAVRENAEEAVHFLRSARAGIDAADERPELGGWVASYRPPWEVETYTEAQRYQTRAEAAEAARAALPKGLPFWTARVLEAAQGEAPELSSLLAWVSRDRA
jgi:hypothetical protein